MPVPSPWSVLCRQDLVYRVHPLPESLIDHVMDYGSLQTDTEAMYITAMLQNLLPNAVGEYSRLEGGGIGHSCSTSE